MTDQIEAPEVALLPPLPTDLKSGEPPVELTDEFVLGRMEALLLDAFVEAKEIEATTDDLNIILAKKIATDLLSLRHGRVKLIWTRRELYEVFRRSQEIMHNAQTSVFPKDQRP